VSTTAQRAARAASVFAVCLAVLACSTPLPPGEPAVGSSAAPDEMPLPAQAQSPNPAFERKQRARALLLERQGQLGDAALAWEVLTVLRPDAAEYRDRLAETRRQVDAAVAERLPRAAQAQQRGELDAATAQYLAVLALQPEQAQAAEALRAIERQRNKRNYLGKYSRLTLTRRSMAEATMPAAAPESNELEHASILASQGDVADAITVLERRLAADKRDDGARRLLADIYFQKGERLAARDKKGAVAALERSLRLDPAHAPAAALLKQVRAGMAPATAAAPATPAASGPAGARAR
jgi:tetratricopeptide (TPR) repeat protein